MIEFTTTERVLGLLRLAGDDPAAARVAESVATANRLVFDHIGRAADDAKFDEPGVIELCRLAADTVAREVHARPATSFGLVSNDELGPVFMSKDSLAGVRSMLAHVQPTGAGFGV